MLKINRIIFLIICAFVFPGNNSYGQSPTDRNWFIKDVHTPISIKPVLKKKKIVIAVVDDGVRITHHDLQKFIWENPKEIANNKIDDDGNGYIDDINGWDVADNNNTVIPPGYRLKDF